MASHRYSPSRSAAIQNETAARTAPHGSHYGEPHRFDPSFKGPARRRSCTDVVCCWIFIIVVLSYMALGIVAWLHGDPKKVLHPTDSYGQFCGQKGTSNGKKPILFYFNILRCANPAVLINLQCPTTQMCVSQCPDKFATYTEMQLQNKLSKSYWEYYRQFCKPGFNNPDKPLSQVLRDEDCPSMIVPSRPFFQRCLPDFIILNGTVTVANRTSFKDALEMAHNVTELHDAAKGLLISLAVCLVFILLLRFTAGLLLWTTIISIILLLAYGMWYCSMELAQLRHTPGSEVAIVEVGLQTDLQVYLQLTQTWIILLVSLGVAEASIFLMLIFLRKRVRVAIALLREASKAIRNIMSTLFFPVITFLLLTVCISYWAVTAVHLASSGEAIYKVISPDVSCPYANSTCNPKTFNRTNISKSALCLDSQCLFAFYGGETSYHRYLSLLQLFNLLVLFWLVNFSLALEQCTLAGTFASYYWARRKPQDIPPCPLFSSFSRAVRYHTGSLAFGALILSVAQLIRIILEYLEQKLKGVDNCLSRFIMHCLKCCFWCLEKSLRYMNRNAYIMVAVYGKNFCTSAREAFFLLMRNVVRVAILDSVTDFLLFLGKVLIAGGVGVVAFFFFTGKIPVFQEEVPNLNYYWVPLLTVVIGAYLIAHGFSNVYAICVDTLFLCFYRKFIIANAQVENCAIIFCNDAFCGMCGYTRAEVMQKPCTCSFLYGPHTKRPAVAQMAKALLGAEERKVEISLYTKDGVCFHCTIDVVPVKNEDGLVIMFILNFELPTDPRPTNSSPARELNRVLRIPWLTLARRQRLRLLLRSLSSSTGVLSQDTELGAPRADLSPLGHESVALEKLLSLPERQQLEEAGAALLLWDQEREDEEEQMTNGGTEGESSSLVAPRQRSSGGGGERRGRELHTGLPPAPSSAPPILTLPLASSNAPLRREDRGRGREEDDRPFHSKHPSSRLDGSRVTLKHSSSVDAIKSQQSYWEKRLQLRHSCTAGMVTIRKTSVPVGASDTDLRCLTNSQQMTQSLLDTKTDAFVALPPGEIRPPCKLIDRTHLVTEKVTQVLSLGADVLPEYKLQTPRIQKWTILHYSPFKAVWDWVILLLVIYTAIFTPYSATFLLRFVEHCTLLSQHCSPGLLELITKIG